MKIIREILTENDNTTHDIFRWLALLSVAVAIFLSVYSVIQGQIWSAQEFGIGLGGLIAGAGVAVGLKK